MQNSPQLLRQRHNFFTHGSFGLLFHLRILALAEKIFVQFQSDPVFSEGDFVNLRGRCYLDRLYSAAEEIDLSGQNQELRGHVLGRICLIADQGRGTADRSSLQDKLRSLKIPEADGRVVRHENSPVRR